MSGACSCTFCHAKWNIGVLQVYHFFDFALEAGCNMVCDACLCATEVVRLASILFWNLFLPAFPDWRNLHPNCSPSYHATNKELMINILWPWCAGLGTRVTWVCLALSSYLTSATISGCFVTAVWAKALYPFSWRNSLQRMCAEVPGALISHV